MLCASNTHLQMLDLRASCGLKSLLVKKTQIKFLHLANLSLSIFKFNGSPILALSLEQSAKHPSPGDMGGTFLIHKTPKK